MKPFVISAIPMSIAVIWCLVFFIVGFLNKDRKKYFLAVIMLIFSFIYIGIIFYLNHQYTLYWYWSNIFLISSLILFPFFYYFVKSTILNYKLSRSDFRILHPAFLFSLFSLILFFLISPEERAVYLQHFFSQDSSTENWSTILYLQKIKITIYPLLLLFIGLLSIINIQNLIKKYNRQNIDFDQTSKKNVVTKLNRLQALLIFTVTAYTIVGILDSALPIDLTLLSATCSLILGIITFMIGYWGYGFNTQPLSEQKEIEDNNSLNGCNKKAYQECKDSKYIIKEKLIALLEKDSIFKNEDLRLADVVEMLHSNRSCTSYVINTMMCSSFSDLINNYRIEHAKKLLYQDKSNSLSLNDIRAQSGFKSNSSFFRVFKQKTGFTPMEYKSNYCPSEKPQQFIFRKRQSSYDYSSGKLASFSTLLFNKLSR